MPSPWPRVSLIIAASLAILLLYHATTSPSSPVSFTSKMPSSSSADLTSKLSITLSQLSTSPLSLSVKVTNNADSPVTILTWDSPLDPAALALGLVKITPSGSDSPLDLPTISFRRVTPPGPDVLVELAAGESTEREIVLREQTVTPEQIFGDGDTAKMVLKGGWTCVWPKKADDLSQDDLEKTAFADGAVTGEFVSNEVEVKRA